MRLTPVEECRPEGRLLTAETPPERQARGRHGLPGPAGVTVSVYDGRLFRCPACAEECVLYTLGEESPRAVADSRPCLACGYPEGPESAETRPWFRRGQVLAYLRERGPQSYDAVAHALKYPPDLDAAAGALLAAGLVQLDDDLPGDRRLAHRLGVRS